MSENPTPVRTSLYLDPELFDRYEAVADALRAARRKQGERGRVRVHELYVRALEAQIGELEREAGIRRKAKR